MFRRLGPQTEKIQLECYYELLTSNDMPEVVLTRGLGMPRLNISHCNEIASIMGNIKSR